MSGFSETGFWEYRGKFPVTDRGGTVSRKDSGSKYEGVLRPAAFRYQIILTLAGLNISFIYPHGFVGVDYERRRASGDRRWAVTRAFPGRGGQTLDRHEER